MSGRTDDSPFGEEEQQQQQQQQQQHVHKNEDVVSYFLHGE